MTERHKPDEGYQILLKIYNHLIQIYDLFGMHSTTSVEDRWDEIFDVEESEHISMFLGFVREMVVEVLDDYEHGKILPYSRRVKMEVDE